MELSKKSELTVGASSFVINTELASDGSPSIQTQVHGADGAVVFETSSDISALRPIFQNTQNVFARMEAQHQRVVKELQEGRLGENGGSTEDTTPPATASTASSDPTLDAVERAVRFLGDGNFEKATAALRSTVETYPDCSEARELLEVAYKAASGTRLPIDVEAALRRGTEAFVSGQKRDAIESWKQCLVEEPGNRLLQLLVLLSSTWSPERRSYYANEVLAPGSAALSSGRPEEAQALLLVAQTVDTPSSESVAPLSAEPTTATPPATEPAGPPEPVPEPSGPPILTFDDPASLESLVPDASETTMVISNEDPSTPPEPATAPEPPPSAAPAPAAETSRPAPPVTRRPPGRARKRDIPWGLVAGGAAALLVAGGAVVWLLSSGNAVPAERLERAASYVRSGQYDQAVTAYDALLGEFGERVEIYEGRGRARIAASDVDGGLADLKRALQMEPKAFAIAEEIGDGYYSRGSFPEAIEYYEKAFVGGKGSAEGRYRLAVSLVQQGDGDKALGYLRDAIEKDREHGEAQFLYAQLLNERGRFAEAEKALAAAEPHLDAGGEFLAERTIALLGQSKHDQAEEVARSFIRSYPNDARAYGLLGEVYLSRKQYEPARSQLIQALRIDRNEPRAQVALGRTWLAIGKARDDRGDLAKARQVLSQARGADEGDRLLALGQVALAEGELETAQRLLASSLDHGAQELPVRLSLAEAKAKSEDLVGAAEELQRASGLAPDDPAISLSLAIAYSQLEEPSRTAEELLRTIQGVGLVTPAGADAGPVMLPSPYIPVPERFDVNAAIRDAYEAVLVERDDDPSAMELKRLAESTTFVLASA